MLLVELFIIMLSISFVVSVFGVFIHTFILIRVIRIASVDSFLRAGLLIQRVFGIMFRRNRLFFTFINEVRGVRGHIRYFVLRGFLMDISTVSLFVETLGMEIMIVVSKLSPDKYDDSQ